VHHSQLFADRGHHIKDGIGHFWDQASRRLRRFNGIKKPESFHWFLKEGAWRFNGGRHAELLEQLKCWYKAAKHQLLDYFNVFDYLTIFFRHKIFSVFFAAPSLLLHR
jgi:hypothetical protein